jgi:acetolactate synthase-1/2/3 large subunit
MAKMTGAQITIESLLAEGVDTIFGYPGGAILPTYDALVQNPALRHILVRHEQGAAHMAEGYARVSGRPGVVLVTSGPGATNTVTGIADAYMDSTPLVVICGQVPTNMIGNDAFQEADVIGITRPCTKHNYLIRDVNDISRTIKEAFHIAGSGRPGPVLIDLPKDVQNNEAVFSYPKTVSLRGYKPTLKGNTRQIERALEVIEQAERPLFYVGGGVQWSGAAELLTELVRGLKVPITTTVMALGVYPSDDPLCLGMLGMHGGYWTNMAVQDCDALIAVGARFDDRVTGRTNSFAPKAKKIVHIDIDPSSISKNIKVDVPIVGDIKEVLQVMLAKVKSQEQLASSQRKWAAWHKHFAAPDRQVVVISGDGSIQMNMQELACAVQYQVPVKVVILNNHYLGMVRQWQEKFHEERYAHSYMEAMPDFVKLAEAYGAKGFRAEKASDLSATLQAAFAEPGPVLVELLIPKSEGVFPMVPAGKAVHEMLFA